MMAQASCARGEGSVSGTIGWDAGALGTNTQGRNWRLSLSDHKPWQWQWVEKETGAGTVAVKAGTGGAGHGCGRGRWLRASLGVRARLLGGEGKWYFG